jgi:hypothetical protein
MKGLIIREPWIGMILTGRKTWEMRGRQTPYRGRVGLIRKGTGMVVAVAEIVDSLPALDPAGFRAARGRHGIPPEKDLEVLQAGWICPWVLSGTRILAHPISAAQKPGAVTWVRLSLDVISEIERQ